ncbi:hypothetical protein QBC41DRAFT_236792 [Cercophora samala]|uniref:DUF7600 domain-containing protein n=1 Tax=Cercophora samala TaxID=330535 RepID=A0AA40D4D5_9PEZI|nr:hypothetical protein QBC41DRAFT_236792 [Cercophora samala]
MTKHSHCSATSLTETNVALLSTTPAANCWNKPSRPILSPVSTIFQIFDSLTLAHPSKRTLECEDDDLYPYRHSCRELFNDRIVVPGGISRVSVSIVEAGDFSYVSGIALTSSGHTITIGHIGPADKEQYTDPQPNDLTGFKVAVGVGGIHAIQCAGALTPIGGWLGCPGKGIKTNRLTSKNPMKRLRFGFDVSIMAPLVFLQNTSLTRYHTGFPKTACGIPMFQPMSSNFNGDKFHPLKTYLLGFKPMFWTHFGGPGGIYLQHLERISLYDGRRLVFKYNTANIPDQCKTFGRAKKAPPNNQTNTCLKIDGPGNERIASISIRQKVRTAGLGLEHTDGLLASFTVWLFLLYIVGHIMPAILGMNTNGMQVGR